MVSCFGILYLISNENSYNIIIKYKSLYYNRQKQFDGTILVSFKVSPNTTPSRKLFPNAADFLTFAVLQRYRIKLKMVQKHTNKKKQCDNNKKKITGRGATDIVRNLNPCISLGLSHNMAFGGGCSVWLPGSI